MTSIGALIAGTLVALPAQAERLRFIAIGDLPYSPQQEAKFRDQIAPAITVDRHRFVIHLGDIKAGGAACSDTLLNARHEEIYALHPGRVFYTPGDNDWTDCDRPKTRNPKPELERLGFLRGLFFSEPLSLPTDWAYVRQPRFPENARWTQGGVLFATVHMVGTNNGRDEILMDDVEATLDLVDARDAANRAWLDEAFAAAADSGADAMVIAAQADVTGARFTAPCTAQIRVQCDGFAWFRDRLVRHAAQFRKPVLYLHGDTNPFCMDKKFGGRSARNLWRLNAAGDGKGELVDAIEITVESKGSLEPFSVVTLVGGQRLSRDCD